MARQVALLICICLTGCATVPPAVIATPAKLAPIPATAENSKSIYVSDLSVKMVDKRIGQLTSSALCVGGKDLLWVANPGVMAALQEEIVVTLSKNGYNVNRGLIKSKAENESDVLIGVGIEDVKANICYSAEGMRGDASLTLRWEIVDKSSGKTYSTTTAGAASVPKFKPTGDPDVFVEAVEMATDNLLAQESFSAFTKR